MVVFWAVAVICVSNFRRRICRRYFFVFFRQLADLIESFSDTAAFLPIIIPLEVVVL